MLRGRGAGSGLLNLRAVSVAAAAGLGIAVLYLRTPYEHNFPSGDVWRIRLLAIETRLLSYLARCGAALRLGTEIGILRYLYRIESSLFTSTVSKSDDIFTEELDADGVKIVLYRRLAWVAAEDEPDGLLRPCVIYLHGGGFVFCSTAERDAHHRHLIEHLDAVIVAVDYGKAPEDPYPAAFRDCVTATKFIHHHSLRLGIDRNRISAVGDSSGGNLTAAVALKLRDEGKKLLKNQVLIYPAVQLLNCRLNSHMQHYPLFSREDGAWCALTYVGEDISLSGALLDGDHVTEDLYQSPGFIALQKYDSSVWPESKSLASSASLQRLRDRAKDPYLCPLMSRTMRSLPPTLMLLCDFDILLDDGLAYADRLRADGVPVEIVRIAGYHGCFRNFRITQCGGLLMEQLVKYLQNNL